VCSFEIADSSEPSGLRDQQRDPVPGEVLLITQIPGFLQEFWVPDDEEF
jgi:hypothetical protein